MYGYEMEVDRQLVKLGAGCWLLLFAAGGVTVGQGVV